MENLQQIAEADAETALNALELIKSSPITSPALFEQAGEELKEIKGEIKRIESIRDAAIKPIQASIAMIKSWFAPALDRLTQAETLRKGHIAAFLAEQAAQQQAALEATRAAVLSGDQAAATAALSTVAETPARVKGISLRESWDFEVIDVSKIPLQFLQPNESAIRAYVKAAKREDAIPGVRAFIKQTVYAGSK
jgi:hypothetical protein